MTTHPPRVDAAAIAKAGKVHARFWQRMGEAFGERWTERHGERPTAPWCRLIDDYPESTVRDALARMSEQKWEHPPSLPIFASYLAKVHSGSTASGPDYTAAYWRSVILSSVFRDGAILYQLWGYGVTLRDLSQPHAHSVVAHVDSLTAEISEMERRTGQRTSGMHDHVQAAITRFLKALRAASTPAERRT